MPLAKPFKLTKNYGLTPPFQPGKWLFNCHLLGEEELTATTAAAALVHVACAENNGGCKHICEGNNEGNRTCACRTGFVLHPDDQDCKEETSEGKIVHFNSLAQPNGSLVLSWKWRGGVAPSKLSGFYLRASSLDNSSLITLPPTSSSFTAEQLRAYTEYDIALWPFYKSEDDIDEKLWKPATLTVHSPASAPTAPSAITPWPESEWQRPDEPTLSIYGPVTWNSKPVGYRVRVEPTDGGDQKERIIKLQGQSNYDLNVTLSVKPGRKYTVFASACGMGDMGETLVGPETTATFGNISVAPIKLLAKVEIADPTSAVLFWQSPSPAERFEITVSLQNFSQGENTDERNIRPYFALLAQAWF
ncbi:collagen alpha-1(XII) chain-like [Haemaphysalis longicornis]